MSLFWLVVFVCLFCGVFCCCGLLVCLFFLGRIQDMALGKKYKSAEAGDLLQI